MPLQNRFNRAAMMMGSTPKAKLGPTARKGTEPTRALDDIHTDEADEAEVGDVDEHDAEPCVSD